MILVIRIKGCVEIPEKINHALMRIRMHKKYSATILNETPENMKLLVKLRDYIAYGKIDNATFVELLVKRGVTLLNEKISKSDAERVIEYSEKKTLSELGIKPFFRLHPPRGGIESKRHAGKVGKGVLGDNKEKINDLVRRML